MSSQVRWVGFIVGLLVLSVAIQVALLLFAINDPSFALEPDYEAKALNWDEAQREREASARLGWTTDLRTSPASAPGEVDVALDLFDRHGKRVHGAQILVEAFHLARSADMLHSTLQEQVDGAYRARLPMRRSGVWEVRLRVLREDDVFVKTLRKSVLSTPRGNPGGAGS